MIRWYNQGISIEKEGLLPVLLISNVIDANNDLLIAFQFATNWFYEPSRICTQKRCQLGVIIIAMQIPNFFTKRPNNLERIKLNEWGLRPTLCTLG